MRHSLQRDSTDVEDKSIKFNKKDVQYMNEDPLGEKGKAPGEGSDDSSSSGKILVQMEKKVALPNKKASHLRASFN